MAMWVAISSSTSFARRRQSLIVCCSYDLICMTVAIAETICCQPIVIGGELFFAGGGDLVEARALIALGLLPLRAYPALAFEAVKRRIERAGLDLEDFAGVRV